MRNTVRLVAICAVALLVCSCRDTSRLERIGEFAAGVAFTNELDTKEPWSIYVARLSRQDPNVRLFSTHANQGALGLSTLTEQVSFVRSNGATPLAAINGDFYQRDRAYAGDPRGLQVIGGEVLSAPGGTASIWIDSRGAPHAGYVKSQFTVELPNGRTVPFGLNEDRLSNSVVLYTPALGSSTRTTNGIELLLEPSNVGAWLPLRLGTSYTARVREVFTGGNTPLTNGIAVLSFGPMLASNLPPLSPGSLLKLATKTVPEIHDAEAAISGGPILVQNGRKLKIDPSGWFEPKSYSARSMFERHPRTAMGWNERFIYLVQVDGRHKTSEGMTLKELGKYMASIGCTEAVNLDGGGSATFWLNGCVTNRPCDGKERPIANGLVAARVEPKR